MFGAFDDLKQEIAEIPDIDSNKRRVWNFSNLKSFLGWTGKAFKFTLQEKEIFLFAFMQIVSIAMAYYVWVQFLGWIPEWVWRSEEKLTTLGLNLSFLAWSFLCVGLASFPVAVFSGCIAASHFLRNQGYPSTIAGCFRLVIPRAWSLWIFYWIDGWFTVNQILERLPKKGDATSWEMKALKELLYYAWKLGTVGILPSLLNGKDLGIAGKESILLVRNHPKEVMLLRGGYSLFCWIIGVSAYLGALGFVIAFPELFSSKGNPIYVFYVWMGIPIITAVAVIQLFLRPIFILGSCELYAEFSVTKEINPEYKKSPGFLYSSFIAFALLAMVAGAVFLYREPLGLMKILEFRAESSEKSPVKVGSSAGSESPYKAEKPSAPRPQKAPAKSAVLNTPAASVMSAAKTVKCDNPIVRIVGDQVEEVCR